MRALSGVVASVGGGCKLALKVRARCTGETGKRRGDAGRVGGERVTEAWGQEPEGGSVFWHWAGSVRMA